MVKKLSISIADWIYHSYLKDTPNRSRYIEEMLVKGTELDVGEFETQKQKLIIAQKEIRDRDEEIKRLTAEIARRKTSDDERYITDPTLRDKEAMVESLKASAMEFEEGE